MKFELDDRLGCASMILALFLGIALAYMAHGLHTLLSNSSVRYEVKQ